MGRTITHTCDKCQKNIEETAPTSWGRRLQGRWISIVVSDREPIGYPISTTATQGRTLLWCDDCLKAAGFNKPAPIPPPDPKTLGEQIEELIQEAVQQALEDAQP